jgi:GNAT superfamily N-acetyltransferase
MNSNDNYAVADLIEEWRPREAYQLRQHYERYEIEAVAELAGEIVGWVSYKIKQCNPEVLEVYEDSTEEWLYIVEVFISPRVRRLGVGRALLRFAEEGGRASGVRYSVLMPAADEGTESGLQQDLLEFYSSLGYDLMKPSKRYEPHGKPWLMGLEL